MLYVYMSKSVLNNPVQVTGLSVGGVTQPNRGAAAIAHNQQARQDQADVAQGKKTGSTTQNGGRIQTGGNGCPSNTLSYNNVSPTFTSPSPSVSAPSQQPNATIDSNTKSLNTVMKLNGSNHCIGQPKDSCSGNCPTLTGGGMRRRRRSGRRRFTAKGNDGPKMTVVDVINGGGFKRKRSKHKRSKHKRSKRKRSKRKTKLCYRCRTCKCRN